jgi:cytochrome c peroxidase
MAVTPASPCRPRHANALAAAFGIAVNMLLTGAMAAAAGADAVGDQPMPMPMPNAMIAFGRRLFESPLLSGDATISCRTCHVPALDFSGDKALAVGVAGFKDHRRAPSIVGLRDATGLMWDGRAATLSTQIPMPLESPEMAIDWSISLRRLRADPETMRLAAIASIDDLDRSAVLSSLVAYVSSLTAVPSRFDRFFYDHDQTALSSEEALGFRVFVQKARCSSCHLVDGRAAPFTDGSFHDIGIGHRSDAPVDLGRGAITRDPRDAGAFKTPSLRGVALRPFLMHDGSVTSLRKAVEYYNRGAETGIGADPRIRPLFLSGAEVDALVSFLKALNPVNPIDASDGRTIKPVSETEE